MSDARHRLSSMLRADLNAAFRDPEVRAVIATRGGTGSYRIADQMDFGVVRSDPKSMVGFSDITNLDLALWAHAGLVTVHGCLDGDAVRSTETSHSYFAQEPSTELWGSLSVCSTDSTATPTSER